MSERTLRSHIQFVASEHEPSRKVETAHVLSIAGEREEARKTAARCWPTTSPRYMDLLRRVGLNL